MGFPLFNTSLGMVAGYYFGKRICFREIKTEIETKIMNRVSLFTSLIMTLICISTAIIALTEKEIGKEIQGMLGLNFEITMTMIYIIIFVGGLGLIVAEYYITKLTMEKTIKLTIKHANQVL
ncbi:MAG: hypothetical protein WAR79_12965 [Melioribacteraceae bacterium]